jgi:hypothetical protein
MSEPEKFVAAGVNAIERTVGLHGLVPFDIVTPAPLALRPGSGVVRLQLDLPPGIEPAPGAPLACRVNGWSAGLVFEHDGRIQQLPPPHFPVELPYASRAMPAIPEAGQLVVDISFRYVKGTAVGIHDVQWRQRISWTPRGARAIELRCALPA